MSRKEEIKERIKELDGAKKHLTSLIKDLTEIYIRVAGLINIINVKLEYLRTISPGVEHLRYYIDDLEEVKKQLERIIGRAHREIENIKHLKKGLIEEFKILSRS